VKHFSIAVCVLLFAVTNAPAITIIVSPSNMGNWSTLTSDPSVGISLATGPGTPPAGTGSLQFSIPPNGDQYGLLADTADFSGLALSALTALTYSTYQSNYINGQAVYLSFVLSNNDRLYFEPIYQTGGYSGDAVPNQCAGVTNCAGLNQWHTWDALAGGWWSMNGYAGSNAGPPIFTLADYAAGNPGVTIVRARLIAGGGAGAWDNFSGAADALAFTVGSTATTFDFESDSAGSAPEPGTMLIVGCGLIGLLKLRQPQYRQRVFARRLAPLFFSERLPPKP
jgi:hypothetical protein